MSYLAGEFHRIKELVKTQSLSSALQLDFVSQQAEHRVYLVGDKCQLEDWVCTPWI